MFNVQSRPRQGCTQWFTGDTGTIMTYGNPGSQQLVMQEMTACVRKNSNKCTITYTPSSSTSFVVGMASSPAAAETTECPNSAVLIPNSQPATAFSGMVCGNIFATTDGATTAGSVTQSCPFQITHRAATSTTAQTGVTGASLNYVQGGC